MDRLLLLVHEEHIRPCVYVVLNNEWIQPRNFSVGPSEDVAKFLEESIVEATSSEDQDVPFVFSSTISGLVEMLILMVGEILAMFPSSKKSCVRMVFLNQSTFP